LQLFEYAYVKFILRTGIKKNPTNTNPAQPNPNKKIARLIDFKTPYTIKCETQSRIGCCCLHYGTGGSSNFFAGIEEFAPLGFQIELEVLHV